MNRLIRCFCLTAGVLVVGLSILVNPWAVSQEALPEVPRPYAGITADQLMKMWFAIKYTTFAEDVQMEGDYYLVAEDGFRRNWKFLRSRILLNRKTEDIDYKDLVVVTNPAQVKGMGVLSWTYLDPKRKQDVWLWIPSLKKVRRCSPSEGEDTFLGSDFTNDEVSTRRYGDETYKLLGEKKFPGYYLDFSKETYYKDLDCYLVEARPKKARWYYSRRIVWLDKETGADIFEEMYDQTDRKFKTILRHYQSYTARKYPTQVLLECKNLRTGSSTVIINSDVTYDQGLSEEIFTQKELMRSRW